MNRHYNDTTIVSKRVRAAGAVRRRAALVVPLIVWGGDHGTSYTDGAALTPARP
jgi:hypothetical protein